MDLNTVIFALLGGVVPSLVWLWFWLREDKKNPEPSYALFKAFIAGVLTVFVAIFFEKITRSQIEIIFSASLAPVLITASWAFIEEFLKFIFAYFSSLIYKYNDEPIDSMIYMITVALGFAAAENTMFLLKPITQSQVIDSIFTGNLRFLGATLLHILASSIVGVAFAFTFNKSKAARLFIIPVSVLLASVAHFAFNYSISQLHTDLMQVFAFVWIALVALLIIFEKIKRLKY